jgi:NAD(P)-dependent dehydrogenase (short-subunit alcohol dehydrogenase family)
VGSVDQQRGLNRRKPSAAVTGAGGGLGRAIAEALADTGYHVYGAVRDPADASDGGPANPGIRFTQCDVTEAEAVSAWAEWVSTEVGDGGLDVLVSNAGVLTLGPMELTPLDVIRRDFEVNVFGSISVINALLPALRTARGRIVQIGSVTGRLPLPFAGVSSAAKAALEAFVDAYRLELRPHGIDVVIAEPGNMRTGGPAKAAADLERVATGMDDVARAHYGAAFAAFSQALNRLQMGGLTADAAARIIVDAILAPQPPTRLPLGEEAQALVAAVRVEADDTLDELRLKTLGLA